MSKCIICGKEVNKTYGNSNLMGVYCRSCATENHYTNEQLIEYSQQKIADLEAKLAEKEKEIEKLIEELDDKNFCRDFVDLYTENRLKTQLLNENWKDKISFTVEQLEKVKDIILNERKITSFNFDIFNKGKDTALFWLNEQIDNQINELKGNVEDD